MKVPFNVNDYVWVKLTPAGLEVLKKNNDQVRSWYPRLPEFTPPPLTQTDTRDTNCGR